MASLNIVPKGAETKDAHEAMLTNGIYTRIEYKTAYVSDGYKTNYESREAHFLVIRRRQENGHWKSEAKRFSGARIPKATETWTAFLKAFHDARPAGDKRCVAWPRPCEFEPERETVRGFTDRVVQAVRS